MNDRQQQLISLLCQRRSDSIQNLAMELGVCERTIRRDSRLVLSGPAKTDSQTNSAAQTPSYWAAW